MSDTSFYSLYKTDTDTAALIEIRVAVLLILHLRFCWKYICVFMAVFCAFITRPIEPVERDDKIAFVCLHLSTVCLSRRLGNAPSISMRPNAADQETISRKKSRAWTLFSFLLGLLPRQLSGELNPYFRRRHPQSQKSDGDWLVSAIAPRSRQRELFRNLIVRSHAHDDRCEWLGLRSFRF